MKLYLLLLAITMSPSLLLMLDLLTRDAGSSNWHWVSICYVGLDAHSTGCVFTRLAPLLVNLLVFLLI